MPFKKQRYIHTSTEYKRDFRDLDDVLYNICKNYPDHESSSSINIKLWIIGRTYATGIERCIKTRDKKQGTALSLLSEQMYSIHNEIDTIIMALRKITEPLTLDDLTEIQKGHDDFMKLLMPVLRKKRTPHSFASKYLHFHCPVVPIYDSFALKALTKLYPWRKGFKVFDMHEGSSVEYGWFLMRFWQLYQDAQKQGCDVSVKLLDCYLLYDADEKRKPSQA